MRILEEHPRKNFENILPLVNVVFLLLIFFMLAGSFGKPDFYKVQTPFADNDKPADRKLLTIVMSAEGRLAVANDAYSDAGLKQFIQNEAKADAELPVIQLKADARIRSERVLEVMELLGGLGIKTVHLLTQSPSVTR